MLTRMGIRNFALIEDMHATFKPGITVITGETGAGKSILIDALSILLGDRASADFIRHGKDKFLLEAVFDVAGNTKLEEVLAEKNILLEEDSLFISRTFNEQGKSQILINDQAVPLKVLRDIAPYLADIHGQYSNQALLDEKVHAEYLDGFMPEGKAILNRYQTAYEAYRSAERKLRNLEKATEERSRELELLRTQIDEIEEAEIVVGEDDALQDEISRFDHVEHLQKVTSGAYSALYDGRPAVLDVLSSIQADVKDAVAYDSALSEVSELLSGAYFQLEEAAHSLSNYSDSLSFDEERYDYCQKRDSLLYLLKKKYGSTLEEVLAFEAKAQTRLEELESEDESKDSLVEEVRYLKEEAKVLQLQLNEYRRLTNERITKLLSNQLENLGMPKATLSFIIEGEDELSPLGAERIELLFSPNPGEGEKSLVKIASGGELSRIALAFTAVFQSFQERMLVFDEIDVGISGEIAIRVAEQIRSLGAHSQVLVITHMPQTVAISKQHLHLEKKEVEGRTVSTVVSLNEEEHVVHMARMIAGSQSSEAALRIAEELIVQLEGEG